LLIIFFCPCFVCRPAPTLWITLRHPLPQALISATRQCSPTLSGGALQPSPAALGIRVSLPRRCGSESPYDTLSPEHFFWQPSAALCQPSPTVLVRPARSAPACPAVSSNPFRWHLKSRVVSRWRLGFEHLSPLQRHASPPFPPPVPVTTSQG
jgi:hypothetical protein